MTEQTRAELEAWEERLIRQFAENETWTQAEHDSAVEDLAFVQTMLLNDCLEKGPCP